MSHFAAIEPLVFAKSPELKALAARVPVCTLVPDPAKPPYEALFRAIVFQQLSGKAANTILNRVIALFDGPFPSPKAILAAKIESLRGAGLSAAKVAAIRDLALKTQEGLVPKGEELACLSDDQIIERLVAVRGVGQWTVEMYLFFTLGRFDIWPVHDLAIRKGYAKIFGLAFEDLKPKVLLAEGEKFRPHRSLVAWLCWRATEIDLPDPPPRSQG